MLQKKLNILFLCTGNSCRSQMAEGWSKHLLSNFVNPYSAGTDPGVMNPLAIRAMSEVGIDLSSHFTKSIDDLSGIDFDYVCTVCDHASEACPQFPKSTMVIHVGFPDPPRLAAESGARTDEEALPHYRKVRDAIHDFLILLPEMLENTDRYKSPQTMQDGEKETQS